MELSKAPGQPLTHKGGRKVPLILFRVLFESSILGGYALVAILLTWPLGRLLPFAVTHPGDPLINSWILGWSTRCLARADCSVFDANIFHPYDNVLAFSENLFGLIPLAAALTPLTDLARHNVL